MIINNNIMEGTIKERLMVFLKHKNIGQNAFEKKVGWSTGYINNVKSSIGADKISSLIKEYPLLNLEWLFTGEGEMIKQPVRNEVEAVPEDKYIMAEYADLRSFAGRLGGSDIEQLPETHKRLLPREYEKGNYLVVRVSGDSNLPIRNRLFIITAREGNVLKQIKEVNKEKRYIVCHSFNTSFEDFTLNFDDIYQIFVIYKIVQKQIRLE